MSTIKRLARTGVSNPLTRDALGLTLRSEVGRTLVDRVRGLTGLYEFDVDDEIRNFHLEESSVEGSILLPLVQGASWGTTYIYCILAHAFRCRGYRPVVPLCHADIDPLCHKKDRPEEGRTTCDMCHYFGTTFFDAFGIRPLELSELLPADYEPPSPQVPPGEPVEYGEVAVSEYATSSACSYLRKSQVDFEDPEERDVYQRFLESATTLVDAGQSLFESFEFDAVLGSHPAYVYGGIFLEQAYQQNVPASVFGAGYRDESLIFGNKRNRTPEPVFTDQEFVREAIREPLSERERAAIDEIMEGRTSGAAVRNYNYHLADSNEAISLPDDRTNLGLFSNLMWDASLLQADVTFTDPYDWVETTIDALGGRDDVHLVVKPHPAEAVRKTEEGMAEWLEESYEAVPDNVTFLEPDTTVNPYSLLAELDVCLVYNSTIGLETAYAGKPAVVVGETHYRGLGFTFDPESPEEYLDILDRVHRIETTEDMQRLARRYAHFLFVRKHVHFPFLETATGDIDLLPVSNGQLTPGNENIDTIVDCVLEDRPVVN